MTTIKDIAERAGRVRNNRNLGHRLRMLLQRRDQRVAYLVVRHDPLFHVGQYGALLLGARDNRLKRDEQILLVDGLPPEAHRAQRRLVHEVGQIRADGTLTQRAFRQCCFF